MLRKSFTLEKPLDSFAFALETFLNDVARKALQSSSGQYVATGLTNTKITTPFSPKVIIISPLVDITTSATTITGNMVFSLAANPGISWLPGTGFKKDCVLSFQNDGFTIGSNTNVNTAETTYLYFVVG